MRDVRFVHPTPQVHPLVYECYYQLGIVLHYLRTFTEGLVAGDEITIHTKQRAAEQQVGLWHTMLKLAHQATYREHDTTWVPLTRQLPDGVEANACFATIDQQYVIFRDAMYDGNNYKPAYCLVYMRTIDSRPTDMDDTVATVWTINQARAVIAAHAGPTLGPVGPWADDR